MCELRKEGRPEQGGGTQCGMKVFRFLARRDPVQCSIDFFFFFFFFSACLAHSRLRTDPHGGDRIPSGEGKVGEGRRRYFLTLVFITLASEPETLGLSYGISGHGHLCSV